MTRQEIVDRHLTRVIQHEIERKILTKEKDRGGLRSHIFRINHQYPPSLRDQGMVEFLHEQIGVINSEIEELKLELIKL
jgi:hypothetical protein